MPRRSLRLAAGMYFHVLNRSARRTRLFDNDDDYRLFLRLLATALTRYPVRLYAYCVMPNHWHLVLSPHDSELPRFMHWLTTMHARVWHERRGTTGQGHVYQNRYRAIPVESGFHLFRVIRYVERNALRANLVARAEDWRWGSLAARGKNLVHVSLTPLQEPLPENWIDIVNQPESERELAELQLAIRDGRPFGDQRWQEMTGLVKRTRGRPKLNRVQFR